MSSSLLRSGGGVAPRRSPARTWGVVILVLAAIGMVIGVVGVVAFRRTRIKGSNPQDRIASICRLADTRPSGAGNRLAQAALEESDASVRSAALVGLARFPDPKYRDTVRRCTDDAASQVRAAAAATLGRYGDEEAARRLGELVTGDSDRNVRIATVIGLGRCAAPEALVWLLEAAEKDPDATVQFEAVKVLYWKLGMRYIGEKMSKGPKWKMQVAFVVEYLKEYPQIQEAYRRSGRELVRHPEHQLDDHTVH